MIPDNVTLIVKAPNQQVEDQNIECLSSWTVRQLKGHLSEVYPSKPRSEEQKIIYSGQLLDDNTILKDVLRTYESQVIHTMHLVCTPTKRMPVPPPAAVPSTDGLRQRNVPTTVPPTATPTVTPTATPSAATSATPTAAATVSPTEPTRPETRQNDQNHNVEMQNYLTSVVNNYGRVPPYGTYLGEGYLPVPSDPALLHSHMLCMQQAYLQYMQQYANMWQATANAAAPPPAEAPPAPPAPAPPAEEDEAHPNDWLDQLYAASRLAILFSLVYLYGSPARLLLVLLLTAAGYLHQIGFFRDLHLNPAAVPAPAPAAPAAPAPVAPAAPAAPAPAAPADAPAQPAVNANREQPDNQPSVNPPNPQPANQEEATAPAAPATNIDDNQQSLLAVTWMIFTTFFASLIPEAN